MRKKLLSEAQVRRFQALATINPLNEMAYSEEQEEVIMKEEEEEVEMETAPDAEVPEIEASPEGDADIELDEELVEKFMDAVNTVQEVAAALLATLDTAVPIARLLMPAWRLVLPPTTAVTATFTASTEGRLAECLGLARALPALTMLVGQTVLPVQKATVGMPPGVSLIV